MTDKKKSEQVLRSKRRFKSIIAICTAVLMLSVSYIMEVSGMWDNIYQITQIGSIYEESSSYPLSITVYDAGDANCVMVRFEEHYILIDSGMKKIQNNISNKLKSEDIERIDLAILSTPDERYIGNMGYVAECVPIDRFITCDNGTAQMPETYVELLTNLHEKNIPVEYVKSGDTIDFGEMNLSIVSPCKQYDKFGDNSLAVRLSYGEFSMLFMGDASKKAQTDMIKSGEELGCDVLLAASQGRRNSVTNEYLRATHPKDVIISTCQTDYIPDNVVLAQIIEYSDKVYLTDISGNIIIESDGISYKIITQFE